MRVIVEEPEKLEKYLEKREKAAEFKALILKMVVELKDIKQVAKIAGIKEQTIYEWIEEWNKKKK